MRESLRERTLFSVTKKERKRRKKERKSSSKKKKEEKEKWETNRNVSVRQIKRKSLFTPSISLQQSLTHHYILAKLPCYLVLQHNCPFFLYIILLIASFQRGTTELISEKKETWKKLKVYPPQPKLPFVLALNVFSVTKQNSMSNRLN